MRWEELGPTEVCDSTMPVGVDDDVLRFDVVVNDIQVMQSVDA